MIDVVWFVSLAVAGVACVGGLISLWSPHERYRTWFRLGAVPVPLMFAWHKLHTINTIGAVYRNVPYLYLWLWVVFWLLVAVVVFRVCLSSADFLARLGVNLGTWIRSGGPLAFWGHENSRFWCWLGILLFSTVMFVAQGFSEHDLSPQAAMPHWVGTATGWLWWLWNGTSSVPASAAPVAPSALPPYPVTWVWGVLMVVAWVITPVSFVCVYRDEVVDLLRRFAEWLRLRRGEASAGTGVSDSAAREARPGVVVPVPVGREQSVAYWVKHILANALPDLTLTRWFHPPKS